MLKSALTSLEFDALLSLDPSLKTTSAIAVGLSGGADSLALTKLLDERNEPDIHALTVDHGLREASANEATTITETIANFSRTTHTVLTWEGAKPTARIQEEARKARYRLMAEYCTAHGITHLFLAHHADDQAETLLFRLAKGSGLDGLTAMRAVQRYNEDLTLVRPLLGVEKARLVATCAHHDLTFIDDPTNFCKDYARPRLRDAREVLEAEGLTTKRLVTTAHRLQRVRNALDEITADIFQEALKKDTENSLALDWSIIRMQPEEIGLRVLIKAIHILKPDAPYLPRMERIESLAHDLRLEAPFRKRTLGGLVFERDDKTKHLLATLEA